MWQKLKLHYMCQWQNVSLAKCHKKLHVLRFKPTTSNQALHHQDNFLIFSFDRPNLKLGTARMETHGHIYVKHKLTNNSLALYCCCLHYIWSF